MYDFARRSRTFDLFKLVGQAENDYPRKGSGFSWYLNNYMQYEELLLSIQNNVRFEPQRNTGVSYLYLPDYYQYKVYTITAPSVKFSHSSIILEGIAPEIFSDINYASNANYSHTLYYDENEDLSSEVHRPGASVRFSKDYHLAEYIRFSPGIELGALGQTHVDADSNEQADDKLNTMVYGRTNENLNLGSPDLYFTLYHDLKYKFFGPDDLYTYGRFRIHELGLIGHTAIGGAGRKYITDTITTAYDLRPVYDWTAEAYEPAAFDKTRFTPLVNSLTVTPIDEISLNDRLVFDIASTQFKTNSFGLLYKGDYIFLNDRALTVEWLIDWEHNFVNPVLDSFSSILVLDFQIHKYWTLYYTVLSRNDNLWRYFPGTAGSNRINPFVDLAKSFNFFNVEHRKESLFKMKSISFGLIHDLHDWELMFDYTGSRELAFDGSKYIWNNTFSVGLGLKEVNGMNFNTVFNDRR